MITIEKASSADFKTIANIAYKVWPITYGAILSKAQLDYMLDKFYSTEGLNKNLSEGHHFLLAKQGGIPLGFASFVHDYPSEGTTKIPKIYVLPDSQGKGIGKKIIEKITAIATEQGNRFLTLNVNRYNKALAFYENIGFEIVAEEDIALEHGYLMEDYILEKRIS